MMRWERVLHSRAPGHTGSHDRSPACLSDGPMRNLLIASLIAAAAGTARAAPDAPAAPSDDAQTYAIIVGSNPGGAGQTELRFAEDDARRVAEVLGDLGGYDKRHIALVLHPSPDAVMSAIDRVGAAVTADRAAGRRSVVFF